MSGRVREWLRVVFSLVPKLGLGTGVEAPLPRRCMTRASGGGRRSGASRPASPSGAWGREGRGPPPTNRAPTPSGKGRRNFVDGAPRGVHNAENSSQAVTSRARNPGHVDDREVPGLRGKIPNAGKCVRAAGEVPRVLGTLSMRPGAVSRASHAAGASGGPATPVRHPLFVPALRQAVGVPGSRGRPEGELSRLRATASNPAAARFARVRPGSGRGAGPAAGAS